MAEDSLLFSSKSFIVLAIEEKNSYFGTGVR